MSPRDGHPDWNELAALADGREPGTAELRRHLAGCRRCTAAYAEAVRLRTIELAAPDILDVAPAMLEAAYAAGPAGHVRRSRRPRLAGALAGMALASLALVAIFVRPGDVAQPPEYAAVQTALLGQAPAGMVLPGLSPELGADLTVYRAGGTVDLHVELETLAARQSRNSGPEPAFWLAAGHLAAGHLTTATDLVREARNRHPDDLRLMALDAVTSYRLSDLGRAETLLREVLVRDPANPPARFNLALVLQETGRSDEARAVLEGRPGRDDPWQDDPWLAHRAAALRDTLR